MNNLERICQTIDEDNNRYDETRKVPIYHVYIPIGLLICFMIAFVPLAIHFNIRPNYFLYTYIACLVLGTLLGLAACGAERMVDVKYERKDRALIIYLKNFDVKQELIDLFKNNIMLFEKADKSNYINEIILKKNKYYLDKFIYEIEKKNKEDWSYYRCIYEYYYFCKHLKNREMFHEMNEKKFEPVYYPD